MALLIIGSTCMKAYLPKGREPKDLDVFTDEPMQGDVFWHPKFAEWLPADTNRFASLDELYTIKVSHSYWVLKNGSWDKHMWDIVELKKLGAQLDPELHKMLYSVWEEKHGKKRVNLQMEAGGSVEEEVWKTYPHDSAYQVSNLGKIRGPRGLLTGTVSTTETPYRQYAFRDKKSRLGHSIVMETFVGPRPEGMEVRHLDGNGLNNRLSNLMYGTKKDNAADRERHGTNIRHERHPLSKLTQEVAAEIRLRYAAGGISQRALASEYGVAQSLIARIVTGQSWKEEKGFFDDAVKRVYVHDSLHESVAYGDEPMYAKFLKDGKSVDIDMQKVWSAPFEDQVKLFREEVYATALERWVVPSNYKCSPRKAYADALRKTITSLTKGWSSTFIVDNYGLFRTPDVDYVQRHLDNKHKLILLEDTNATASI